MALTLWNVLATGHIRSDADEEQRQASGQLGRHVMGPWLRTADEKKMCAALEVVAQQVGAKHITAGKLPIDRIRLHRNNSCMND
jgi:hypothetical protein